MFKWLLLTVSACLVSCMPMNKEARQNFASAKAFIAANDAVGAAASLRKVIHSMDTSSLRDDAVKIVNDDAFGEKFLQQYLQRMPNMSLIRAADTTDVLFYMLDTNPALLRRGDTVWEDLCGTLQTAADFPLTARVGERLPCRDTPVVAKRIYANSVNYLRSRADVMEFDALARFVQNPAQKSYLAQLKKDLPTLQLDRTVIERFTFEEVAGKQAKAIAQAALPGYALKLPPQFAAFEQQVHHYMESNQDIRSAEPNEPNTLTLELSNINMQVVFNNLGASQHRYRRDECTWLDKRDMPPRTEYRFLAIETERQSIFTATAHLRFGKSIRSLPLLFVLKEQIVSCEDFTIAPESSSWSGSGYNKSTTRLANGYMASLCSGNSSYMSQARVWDAMAKIFAEKIAEIVRTLKK